MSVILRQLYHTLWKKYNEILATFPQSDYTDNSARLESFGAGKDGCRMDLFEKVGDSIAAKGREVSGKAKDLAEIASLKSQIAACEEVIKKNYLEIGRLFMEQYKDAEDTPFEKQRTAILNARAGVEDLQRKIRQIKGL